MPITWNDYLGLRRTSTKDYVDSHNIETYADLVLRIDKKDVIPPVREEVHQFFPNDKSFQDIRDSIREKEELSDGDLYKWKPSSKVNAPPSQKQDISKRKPKRTRKRQKADMAKE